MISAICKNMEKTCKMQNLACAKKKKKKKKLHHSQIF